MKITVLLENTKCQENLTCEHGLSLYMEANGKKILLDAGQSSAFADNAEKLGIDLSEVDFCVLSHGHYDHGGGLKRFLEINKQAKVIASPYAFGIHHHGREKYIGLDQSLNRKRFWFLSEKTELAPGIVVDPCSAHWENAGDQGLSVLEGGVLLPETFRHEQYLLVTEEQRRFCFSGCSHRGITNIMEWLHPDIFVGGFHLSKAGETEVRSVAQTLAQYNATYFTGHCTGETQFAWMKTLLGGRLDVLPTGRTLVL